MDSGRRITLRQLDRADLEPVLRWRNDPDVTQFLADETTSPGELEEWYDYSTNHSSVRLYAVDVEDRQLIGYVGLQDIDWRERTASLYIVLGEKKYWDRGYGRETMQIMAELAFEDLDLSRLDLSVLPFNVRAITCYERSGFRHVGFLTDWYFRRGRSWHPVHMRMTRAQYQVVQKTWQ